MQYWRFETIYYIYGESSDLKPLSHSMRDKNQKMREDEGLQIFSGDDFLSRLEYTHKNFLCLDW